MQTKSPVKQAFVPWDSQDLDTWTQLYATGKTISLDGKVTHYIQKGEGPPLILIHGFFSASLGWRLNIDDLSKAFTVYAPDLWGLGFSTREPLDYGWKLYAGQIKLFMDALGIDTAHIAGLSMGGGIAVQFANAFPEMVEKMVFVSPAVFPQEKKIKDGLFSWPLVGPMLLNLKTDKIRKTVMLEKFYSDAGFLTEEGYRATTWHQKIKGTTAVLCGILRAGFIGDQVDGVKKLADKHKPTLIFWGGRDKTCAVSGAERLKALLPGSQLELFETAGHLPHAEDPERFNNRVIEFLSGT